MSENPRREREWTRERTLSTGARGRRVGLDRLRRPDDEAGWYGLADLRDSVAVVAREADEVVLVEEYRPALRETVLSCPVGGVRHGESLEEAAARELEEETGFVAGELAELGRYYPVSWLRKRRGVVFATDLTPGAPDREAEEFMDVRTLPVEDALAVARGADDRGPATGWTLSSVLLAREEGLL